MKYFQRLSILTVLLASFGGLSAYAKVECAVFQGTSCTDESSIVYRMRICDDTSLNNGTCKQHCGMTKPICNVEDFSAWSNAYQGSFTHHELGGSLATGADNFDEDGTLAAVSEKMYVVCQRDCGSAVGFITGCNWSGWSPISQMTACPKSKAANCTGGVVYDRGTGKCSTNGNVGCDSGNTKSFTQTIFTGEALVATQNNHFAPISEIDPNHAALTANTTKDTGLQAPTKGASTSIDGMSFPATKGSRGGSGDPGALTSSNGGFVNPTSGDGSKDAKTGSGDPSMLAATYLGNGSDGGKGAQGGSGGAGGGSNGSGGGWFDSKGATPGDGAASEVGFNGGSDASRGLASDGSLRIEDPSDYFMRAGMDLSLFKRVTAQHRKKEKDLVLIR